MEQAKTFYPLLSIMSSYLIECSVISRLASLATSGGEAPSDNTGVYYFTITPGDAPRSWIVHISDSDMHDPPGAVRDALQAGLRHLVCIESDVLQWHSRPN